MIRSQPTAFLCRYQGVTSTSSANSSGSHGRTWDVQLSAEHLYVDRLSAIGLHLDLVRPASNRTAANELDY
jgi:hypothetical protein